MATAAYLFDTKPYKRARKNVRKRGGDANLPPDVRHALLRLKITIDTIPREEWDRRRRRVERAENGLSDPNAA